MAELNSSIAITVNELCHRPLRLYENLSVKKSWKKTFKVVQPIKFNKPKPENHLRFVCISDTHNQTENMEVPDGDVLLHAGDFTQTGLPSEVEHFIQFLDKVRNQFKEIIVIAGNHDLTFDVENYGKGVSGMFHKGRSFDCEKVKNSLKDKCIYLEDEGTVVSGINIYGSPWQPEFGDWGFNLERGEKCLEKWNMIPENTDILITHGPALGHGDRCKNGARAGCSELLSTIQARVKPKYHIFGHIHEGYGITTDGVTTFINASSVNLSYKQINDPIIFDMPIPKSQ